MWIWEPHSQEVHCAPNWHPLFYTWNEVQKSYSLFSLSRILQFPQIPPGQSTPSRSGKPCLPPRDLPNPGIEPTSPTLQVHSLPVEPQAKPKNTGVVSLSLLQWIFPTLESNGVSCIAGGFFTNWAIREAQI